MTEPTEPEPREGVRDLSDEEYDRTYETGSGGHELPPEVLAELNDDEHLDDGDAGDG